MGKAIHRRPRAPSKVARHVDETGDDGDGDDERVFGGFYADGGDARGGETRVDAWWSTTSAMCTEKRVQRVRRIRDASTTRRARHRELGSPGGDHRQLR